MNFSYLKWTFHISNSNISFFNISTAIPQSQYLKLLYLRRNLRRNPRRNFGRNPWRNLIEGNTRRNLRTPEGTFTLEGTPEGIAEGTHKELSEGSFNSTGRVLFRIPNNVTGRFPFWGNLSGRRIQCFKAFFDKKVVFLNILKPFWGSNLLKKTMFFSLKRKC